jgi:hypothetical protein
MDSKKKKVLAIKLAELQKAAKEGRIAIGNGAALSDNGEGSVKAWVNGKYFGVEYSIPGIGFGGFSFGIVDAVPRPDDPEGNIAPSGRISVDSEAMSRDFVKAVMCKLIDEADWDHSEMKS